MLISTLLDNPLARKIVIGVAALIAVLLLVVATRPSTFHVERSLQVTVPPEFLFAQVDDFRAWRGWSPWEQLDPAMKRTFSGPSRGVGAVYAWTGNDKVGEGRMTIEKSVPTSSVEIKLEFVKPFASTSQTTFRFVPAGADTKITWSMDGRNDFLGKAFSLFMDTDRMIGGDFERGLASLGQVSQAMATARAEFLQRTAEARAKEEAAAEAKARAEAEAAAAAAKKGKRK